MGTRYIPCELENEYLIGAGVVAGAAGSHDDVYLRIRFGSMWDGLNKYVTFRDALGENPTMRMLTGSMRVEGSNDTYDVSVPAAAKALQGRMMVTVYGYSVSNGTQEDTATLSATAYFRVLPSDYSLLDDGSIDATIAQQFQAEMQEMQDQIDMSIPVEVTEENTLAELIEWHDAGRPLQFIMDDHIYYLVSITSTLAVFMAADNSSNVLRMHYAMASGGGWALGYYDVQEKLTYDNLPTSGSDNSVTSGGIFNALTEKQDTLVYDQAPTYGSDHALTSGTIFTALTAKQDALVSGTNIKTINGSSILGSGNLIIEGGGGEGEVFIATYGVTTLSEIKEAVQNGQTVFARRGNDILPLARTTVGFAAFSACYYASTTGAHITMIFCFGDTSASWEISTQDIAPLDSPALSGTPTAPTAATATNNTQIATTAFVHAAIGEINTALEAML